MSELALPTGRPYPARPPAPSELHEHVRATTVRGDEPETLLLSGVLGERHGLSRSPRAGVLV